MGKVERFEDLIAWQKARELTKQIYLLTFHLLVPRLCLGTRVETDIPVDQEGGVYERFWFT